MFDLHNFILETIKQMIHKEPDYKVRQYALGWYDKSILTEEDLTLIEELLNENFKPEEEIEE